MHTPRSRYEVPTIDVTGWPRLGPYWTPPADRSGIDYEGGFDFRVGQTPVWSIGIATRDLSFQFEGATVLVPTGTVLLSTSPHADLYGVDGINCVWLR